ncbi:hypothetical protein B1218_34980, partial [Pseudomonas ogarae]
MVTEGGGRGGKHRRGEIQGRRGGRGKWVRRKRGREEGAAVAHTADSIGGATAMQEVGRAAGRRSRANIAGRINGEAGTGKDVVARALQRESARAASRVIALNMAAIPKDRRESE